MAYHRPAGLSRAMRAALAVALAAVCLQSVAVEAETSRTLLNASPSPKGPSPVSKNTAPRTSPAPKASPAPKTSPAPKASPTPKKSSPPPSKPNSNDPVAKNGFTHCITMMPAMYNVWWKISGGTITIGFEHTASASAWSGFGFNTHQGLNHPLMVGSDAVVAGYDGTTCFALDYHLTANTACTPLTFGMGAHSALGACPDTEMGHANNVKLISCHRTSKGYFIVASRPLKGSDASDITWPTSTAYPTWAYGLVTPGVGKPGFPSLQPHQFTGKNAVKGLKITLGAAAKSSCPRIIT